MRFTWHEEKRRQTLAKRGLDFADAEKVVVIVHTETEDEIRVISMREAEANEQLLFFTNL